MPLKFEHEGTVKLIAGDHGEHVLALDYEGRATKTKDMAMGTKTLDSYGDFVVTGGTGAFADLAGAEGTYNLTLVCAGSGKPMVGDPVELTFSASSE